MLSEAVAFIKDDTNPHRAGSDGRFVETMPITFDNFGIGT